MRDLIDALEIVDPETGARGATLERDRDNFGRFREAVPHWRINAIHG